MADLSVAEEVSARAAQPVVVHRGYDWNRGVVTGAQDRRRHQRESVVDVDDIRSEPSEFRGETAPGGLGPQDAGRQCGTPHR